MDLVIVEIVVLASCGSCLTNGRSNTSLLSTAMDDEGKRRVATVKSKRNATKLTRISRFPITIMLTATRRWLSSLPLTCTLTMRVSVDLVANKPLAVEIFLETHHFSYTTYKFNGRGVTTFVRSNRYCERSVSANIFGDISPDVRGGNVCAPQTTSHPRNSHDGASVKNLECINRDIATWYCKATKKVSSTMPRDQEMTMDNIAIREKIRRLMRPG